MYGPSRTTMVALLALGGLVGTPTPSIHAVGTTSNGAYGAAYSHSFTATGGTPIRYSITQGSLPPGLILDGGTGQLGSTPTQAGSFGPIMVAASNGSATQSVTIGIAPATLAITADAKTRAYGAANPTLTYTVGGLVNGDTAEIVLTGALATTATAGSPPGSYATDSFGSPPKFGGGMYNDNSSPTLANVTLRGNGANLAAGCTTPTATRP